VKVIVESKKFVFVFTIRILIKAEWVLLNEKKKKKIFVRVVNTVKCFRQKIFSKKMTSLKYFPKETILRQSKWSLSFNPFLTNMTLFIAKHVLILPNK
jgi:hypothetical protein